MYVIKNCKFIKALTEGVEFESGDVVIKDGLIDAIVPCGTPIAEEHESVDIEGATLMPGLIDMHVHLFMTGSMYEMQMAKPLDRVFECYRYAKNLLDCGYTTVRDVGDAVEAPSVSVSKAIDSGLIDGPRIVPSCGTICPHEPGVEVLDYIIEYVNGPMEVRDVVRKNFQKGAQFIKLYGSGSMMAVGSEPGLRIMEPDEISEAVKMAKNKDTYVAIHAHGTDAIDVAVRCGVRTIEHASFISDETVQYIKSSGETTGIVPTLSVFFGTMEKSLIDDASGDFFAQRARQLLEKVKASLKNAYNNGILIGWGTDISLPEFLEHPYGEFKLRKEQLEYSNEDILKQATINSAKLMMMDEKIGSIKKGKCADLIVVNGDPTEDISVMYNRPTHVIKGGKLIR